MGRMIRGAVRVAAVVAVAIAMLGLLACGPAPSGTNDSAATPGVEVSPTPSVALPTPPVDSPTSDPATARPTDAPASPTGDALGEADGVLPARVTVFDDEFPGVANLDPRLLEALREAATDAAQERIVLRVTSGWRSADLQDQLFRDAVEEYGSEEEAAKWVATADKSAHVSGDAVDIAPAKAQKWLSEHGADYGLCQIYRNEPWHFELRIKAVDGRCPRMYADPSHDPRMQ